LCERCVIIVRQGKHLDTSLGRDLPELTLLSVYAQMDEVQIRFGRNQTDMTTRQTNRRGWRISIPAATDFHSHGVTQDQIESLAAIMRQAVQQEQIAGGLVSSCAQRRNRLSRGVRICRYRIETTIHNGRIASDRIGLQTLSGKRVNGPG
jgi:hypothetical protein